MKEYKMKINGNDYAVAVASVEDNIATVTVNGTQYEVEVSGMTNTKATKTPKIVQPAAVPSTDSHPATAKTSSPKPGAPAASGAGAIKSPLPGVILDIRVKAGDAVKAGDKLLVLEAMKMENNIESDKNGTIKEVRVHRGDSVLEGDVLLTIE